MHEAITASNPLEQNACGRIIEKRLRSPGKAPGTGQEPANDIMAQDGQSSTHGPHEEEPTNHQNPHDAQPQAQPIAQPNAQHSHACYDACAHEAYESTVAQRAANALIELVAILILDVFLYHTLIESEQQPVAQPGDQPGAQPVAQPIAQPVAQSGAQPLEEPNAQPKEEENPTGSDQTGTEMPRSYETLPLPVNALRKAKGSCRDIQDNAGQQCRQTDAQPGDQPVDQPVAQPLDEPGAQPLDEPVAQLNAQPYSCTKHGCCLPCALGSSRVEPCKYAPSQGRRLGWNGSPLPGNAKQEHLEDPGAQSTSETENAAISHPISQGIVWI